MARNISFALTTEQFKNKTKTVTRRLGWRGLKIGTILMGCKKCMGLRPGEQIERLGMIRVTGVFREKLLDVAGWADETAKEGFPEMTPDEFIVMFCKEMKCTPSTEVTRIEFEYL